LPRLLILELPTWEDFFLFWPLGYY
jgi:hypothetical protein